MAKILKMHTAEANNQKNQEICCPGCNPGLFHRVL